MQIEANNPNVKREQQHHYVEGKSPAAWAGSLTALAGFIIITLAIVFGPIMSLIYFGSALVVVAAILTIVLKNMGYGTPERHYSASSLHGDTPAGNQ